MLLRSGEAVADLYDSTERLRQAVIFAEYVCFLLGQLAMTEVGIVVLGWVLRI